VWQSLYEELKDRGLTVITVALDSGGSEAARPFIERAKPTHPSLIDRRHAVADRYQFVNVPSAVWIDERGVIVRPAHTPAANAAMAGIIGIGPEEYLDAVRDWAANGDRSRFVPPVETRRGWQHQPDDADVIAALNFRLGEYLIEHGGADAARPYLEEAVRLRPESWAYRRQAWALYEPPEKNGTLWYEAAVAHPRVADEPYYPPVQLTDVPAPRAAEIARKQREIFAATFGKAFAKQKDAPPEE
jgi:hypothetical protein